MTSEILDKSLNDSRRYKYLKLPNGLRALLIRDPEMAMTQEASGDGELSCTESDSPDGSSEEVADP